MDNRNVRKISRKVKRCEEILLKHENIATSKQPSNSLFIGNGGLGCCVQRELLLDAFSSYGEIENIVMLPEKPYAFAVFREVADAEKAMVHMNGQRLKSGHVFYMSYIANKDVPKENPKVVSWPEGLVLLENFITEEEEKNLIAVVNVEEMSDGRALLKHRKVKHYGYEFIYGSNNIDKSRCLEQKIPEACLPHLQRLVALGYLPRVPDQLTVNHYLPGQGIPPHIDTHSAFEDGIVSISLGSQVVMDFYCPGQDSAPVLLPTRSALIMLGESRYRWKHGITPRKTDVVPAKGTDKSQFTLSERSTRTSLTFRLIREGECNCKYTEQCDSQSKSKPCMDDFVNDKGAEELEKIYVNQVYERIADHFSVTRYKPWPKVAAFLNGVARGSFVLDVGCGNGKNTNLSSCCFEVGCDASSKLAHLCSQRNVEVMVADCLRLPFRTNCVDVVVCIAVIHHMSTRSRRVDAVREIVRVLRPGGRALIYVWAFEQESADGPSNYLKANKTEPDPGVQFSDIRLGNCEGLRLPLHENRTHFANQDMLVPWKEKVSGTEVAVHHRYYHVFTQGELETLVLESEAFVLSSYYDKGNWCVLMQKDSLDCATTPS